MGEEILPHRRVRRRELGQSGKRGSSTWLGEDKPTRGILGGGGGKDHQTKIAALGGGSSQGNLSVLRC